PSPNPYATASPFYVRSGNYVTSATDVSIPTRGFRLTVWRFYDSARYVDGPFGFGWGSNLTTHLSYTTYIDPVAGSQKIASVVLGDGTTYDFLELSNGI